MLKIEIFSDGSYLNIDHFIFWTRRSLILWFRTQNSKPALRL